MKNKKRLFLTGTTGFLGSHIAEFFLDSGYEVIGLKRSTSNLFRCKKITSKIIWISSDEPHWQEQVISLKPDFIIHAAWIGVSAKDRNDWESQIPNVKLTNQILDIAIACKVEKIIGLGSQAEYGVFSGKITEEDAVCPNTAYGVIKHTCSEMARLRCEEHEINWYWLRLFSFFGEGEADQWLIPSLIRNMLTTNSMDFTSGEQKYAYLYVKDLALALLKLIEKDNPESGIYNLSSSQPISLKEMITKIRDYLNPAFELKFGNLPYRLQQSMHIEGDVSKYEGNIGKINDSDFWEKLLKTVDYYKNHQGKE